MLYRQGVLEEGKVVLERVPSGVHLYSIERWKPVSSNLEKSTKKCPLTLDKNLLALFKSHPNPCYNCAIHSLSGMLPPFPGISRL